MVISTGLITSGVKISGNVNKNIDKKVEKSWVKDHTLMCNHFGHRGWELVSHSLPVDAEIHEYHFKRVS